MNEVVLEIKDLCKKYSSFELSNVSFCVNKGTIMGFIGRNGAGKTTTLKSLLNIVHPDGGKITFWGLDWDKNENEIKQRIGFSSSGINFYPTKTLRSIINNVKVFYKNWDEDTCNNYMQIFNLNYDKKIRELSEGMKVKFNLVLALSHCAEFLILDEPTSGLDPVSRDELLTIFKDLRDKGIAILFSTHITSDLDKCADFVTYIKNGKIIASGEKNNFIEEQGGGTLEDIMLRIEKGEK